MATTSSTSFLLRIPATYPYNQNLAGQTGNINTDTETRPSVSASSTYVPVAPPAYSAEKRNVQVQIGNFYTDVDAGACNFQTVYTTVPKSAL